MRRPSFLRNRSGSTMVEMGLLAPVVLLIMIAVVELSVFMWQWNSAHRTTRAGARLAGLTSPVVSNLSDLVSGEIGEPLTAYSVNCDGSTQTCSQGDYNSAAMARIVTGGDGICSTQTEVHLRGLCDMMPDITAANVFIEYRASLNEVGGAPGGLQPIVTLSLKNISLSYTLFSVFNGELTSLPTTSVSVLGQDLSDGSFE